MEIEDIKVAIFHRKGATKIKTEIHGENSYGLGEKEVDDNFRIEFSSTSEQNFLVFHNHRDEHYEYIEGKDGIVSTEISLHKKLILVTIKNGSIVNQYNLEIKHENHKSLFYFLNKKEIKFFLHSNGMPDSYEIDRKKHQVFLNIIFSRMDESELKKIS